MYNLNKLLFVAIMLSSAPLYAEPYLIDAPGYAAKHYTPVVVIAKKLRTSLADARDQFPGEEYLVSSDSGASLRTSPAVFNGLWTYGNMKGIVGFPRPPKVDGLKPVGVVNFTFSNQVNSPLYPVEVSFPQLTTEFGAYLGTTNTAGGIFADRVTVKVKNSAGDVTELGTVSLPAFTSTFVGVRDEAGLETYQVIFEPHYPAGAGPDAIAGFVSDSFYLE